jgi:hypothetical protein
MTHTFSTHVDARSFRAVPGTLVLFSTTLALSPPAHAENAVSVGSALFAFNSVSRSQGWRFTVDVPIQITAMGILDAGDDGLATSHDIAIWDEAGTMLHMTTVEAGVVNPLFDRFRYASIEEGVAGALLPGQTYTIGYFLEAFSDDTYIIHNVHTMHPLINQVGGSVSTPGSSLTMPTTPSASQCFGAGFQFVVVPAPSSLMLLIAAGFVTTRRRRERCRTAAQGNGCAHSSSRAGF